MTLTEAIAAMREGMLVRRTEQLSCTYYAIHENEIYMIDLGMQVAKIAAFKLRGLEDTNWIIVAKPFKE